MAKSDKPKDKASSTGSTKKTSLRGRPSKKQQTVRERAQQSNTGPRRVRVRKAAGKISTPFKKIRHHGKKEVHVVPLPDNKVGKVLGKRVRLTPGFVRDAWREIKLVRWPNARETIRLTIAVFIFAVVFAVIVGLIDFGLDKLFREVIIGR